MSSDNKNNSLAEEYKALNEKCDNIITKIKSRKKNKKNNLKKKVA